MKKSEAVIRLDKFILKIINEKERVTAEEILNFITANDEEPDNGLGFYPPLTKKGKYDYDAE